MQKRTLLIDVKQYKTMILDLCISLHPLLLKFELTIDCKRLALMTLVNFKSD